jgi:D-alanyl-D-alanine dipeptidase
MVNEQYRPEVISAEQRLGIHFVKPDTSLIDRLNSQITIIARNLNAHASMPIMPIRGFIDKPLLTEQRREIDQLIEPGYAGDAVDLQDRLTTIPVRENGERMVHLPTLFERDKIPLSLSSLPFHEACGEWAGKGRVFWVRQQVAEHLLRAGIVLDKLDIVLHIEDAFRPVGVQEGLFLRRAKMILQEHPEWINSWDKVWAEARSKTAISPLMAGHKSGAALDITLRKKSNGEALSIGNRYPEGGAKVALRYPYITQEEWAVRQLFVRTMEMAGLRRYPYETWHISYGDLSAGISADSDTEITSGYEAMYGPIEGFNSNGKVIPSPTDKYNQPFYSQSELLDIIKREGK